MEGLTIFEGKSPNKVTLTLISQSKFIDLAELSRSGCLMPPQPLKLLLKYDPPKLTMVYHFESNETEQYFHDVDIAQNMLDGKTAEEIAGHLYMTEDYYFNAKFIKRKQVSLER